MARGGQTPSQPIRFTPDGLVDGDDLFGFCGFCNEPGHRAKDCTALGPATTGPGRETSPRPGPVETPSLTERLVGLVFCPACLCVRAHPTHLLVCDDRRRKVIRRAR